MSINHLIKTIEKKHPGIDTEGVRLAYEFAENAHRGQKRMSGEAYIVHPLGTAQMLAEMDVDLPIIIAALLHDVPEDTHVTNDEIKKNFGEDIGNMVEGITKLGKIKYRGVERYIENLRKMFVSMAQDSRTVLIKFADRLNNLLTLEPLPPKKRYRIALETIEIYAPIANRLGMGEIKGQLEDAAFKYVHPKEYEWVRGLLADRYNEKKKYLEHLKEKTKREIQKSGVRIVSVHGRSKHLYSLYQKLLTRDRDITKIYDLVALRIVVQNIADCYAVLGILHTIWKPLKGRIKDYIAQPKPNGYRSLHTTVFADEGEIVEFQIRTPEMHRQAEYGIATHWVYKEKGQSVKASKKELPWMQELAKAQKDLLRHTRDVDLLKLDVFQTRIFVFTPKGDVIDLPENATPIDLAYAIHTYIGNKCSGVRINDQLLALDTPLKNGDVVEILTDKNRKGPSPDWLKFVKTAHARNHIKQHMRHSVKGWIQSILPEPVPKE